jgi:hypothetical protein
MPSAELLELLSDEALEDEELLAIEECDEDDDFTASEDERDELFDEILDDAFDDVRFGGGRVDVVTEDDEDDSIGCVVPPPLPPPVGSPVGF